ncbi:MAG: peptidyl-tRNA hydrolase, partial [Candidatus Bathyarchaeia archaeon]
RGLPAALVRDMGLTQLPPGTATCAGIGPAPEPDLDALVGRLKLL